MTIHVNEAFRKAQILTEELARLVKQFGYECEDIEYDHSNPEQALMKSELYSLATQMDNIHWRMNYLNKPIRAEGVLSHNSDGRYELPSGDYFTSGSMIEVLTDKWGDFEWVLTAVEHNGSDYYAAALGRDFSINGLTARIR